MIEAIASGSGGFRSIQAAVDAAQPGGDVPSLILIRDGAYDEPVLIGKGRLRIVGESAQRVILKQPIQISSGDVELENFLNGTEPIGQHDARETPSLFLCGCREAVPQYAIRQGYYVYDETLPGCTLKQAAVTGVLGRVELFLRPGDSLALVIGLAEGEPGRFFTPGDGGEFQLYLHFARSAALENKANFHIVADKALPASFKKALSGFAIQNSVPYSERTWLIQ